MRNISIGDIVIVKYNQRLGNRWMEIEAIVRHMPSDVGDCWCFEMTDQFAEIYNKNKVEEWAQNPTSSNFDSVWLKKKGHDN